jgi:outer membrane protein assembly factor BamB
MHNRLFGSVTSHRYFPTKWKRSALFVLGLAIILTNVYFAFPQYHAAQATHGSNTDTPGDWPMYMYNVGRSSYNTSETTINQVTAPNLKQEWVTSDSSGDAIFSQPVVANGVVYWGSFDGVEHATPLNGSLDLWDQNLGSTSTCDPVAPSPLGVVSSAAVVNGIVYVGGGDHSLYALNASTGTILWDVPLGVAGTNTFVWDSPLVVNNNVYIGTATTGEGITGCKLVQGQLYELNATTGQQENIYNIVPNGCVGGGLWSSPVYDISDNSIYFTAGTQGGNTGGTCKETNPIGIVKLNASTLQYVSSWQIPTIQRLTKDADFAGTPTLFTANGQNMVGAVDKNGYFYAFSRASLSNGPAWSVQIAGHGACPQCGQGSISSAVWDGTTLYIAGGITTINSVTCGGSVRALDPTNITFLWEECLPKTVIGAVTEVPGVIAVVDTPNLTLLNSQTGVRLFNSKNKYYGSPSISNGVLYVGSVTGHLYAFWTQP